MPNQLKGNFPRLFVQLISAFWKFSRSMEKQLPCLISMQLKMTTKHVISDVQHGFCQGRSTTTNLLLCQNFLVDTLEKSEQVGSIYGGLAEAFYRVNYKVLRTMNFDEMFVQWIASFISNRPQVVRVGSSSSNIYHFCKIRCPSRNPLCVFII